MSISKVTMDAVKLAKRTLRNELQELINKISNEEKIRQSNAVYKKLINTPEFKVSEKISVYLSTENEINTVPILEYLFKNNKQVFVPKYQGKNMMMVKLYSMDDYHKLPLTKWNIKQPANDDNTREDCFETGGLDLIILPGVAFTNTGKRLGHGMGYYDKFIESCIKSQQKKPFLVAVAFNEQIKTDIPTTDKDMNLDMVITEKST
ncbi:5-formyltetrahydrofolate cyclo-ligase [Microplitis mediator]|uniref:5-formyltetrahydrofolate cyclo-ligase n=1 Tax=Microplitis mediator TaxID=375433 RepID=UPI00255461A1|nr:5-formyltetrahydrofolate cyclo-ligase [Microplitis mediator]XP_057336791.1 5-formyltetrahydrofolate cyclo-ligase [Microplitis mediator]